MSPMCGMISFYFYFILVLNFVYSKRKLFFLDIKHKSSYNDKTSCPKGYRLAVLDDPADWERASQLVSKALGPNKSVWIRYGLRWRGLGNEFWSLITPKPPGSCHFPPKSLKSFCVPFYKARLSPNRLGNAHKFPSLCESI